MTKGQREDWIKSAENPMLTNNSFKEQLGALRLEPSSLKGKTILVLGPGMTFDFEKGAAKAGAQLVVPLSYSYDRHQSVDAVRKVEPAIQPIRGLFQELPPAYKCFDYIVSVMGFPLYLAAGPYPRDEVYITEVRAHFHNLIDLLAPEGEARLMPVSKLDKEALAQLQEERKDLRITVVDSLAIIRKRKSQV